MYKYKLCVTKALIERMSCEAPAGHSAVVVVAAGGKFSWVRTTRTTGTIVARELSTLSWSTTKTEIRTSSGKQPLANTLFVQYKATWLPVNKLHIWRGINTWKMKRERRLSIQSGNQLGWKCESCGENNWCMKRKRKKGLNAARIRLRDIIDISRLSFDRTTICDVSGVS